MIQSFTRKTTAIPKSFQMLRNCHLETDFSGSGVRQGRWVFSPREVYQNSSEEGVSIGSIPGAKWNRSMSCSTLWNDLQVCHGGKKKKAKVCSRSQNVKSEKNHVLISQLPLRWMQVNTHTGSWGKPKCALLTTGIAMGSVQGPLFTSRGFRWCPVLMQALMQADKNKGV